MRFHRLSIAGFGPFAGEEVIDFDRLGSAGLFLLSGPTGAGKTACPRTRAVVYLSP